MSLEHRRIARESCEVTTMQLHPGAIEIARVRVALHAVPFVTATMGTARALGSRATAVTRLPRDTLLAGGFARRTNCQSFADRLWLTSSGTFVPQVVFAAEN